MSLELLFHCVGRVEKERLKQDESRIGRDHSAIHKLLVLILKYKYSAVYDKIA